VSCGSSEGTVQTETTAGAKASKETSESELARLIAAPTQLCSETSDASSKEKLVR